MKKQLFLVLFALGVCFSILSCTEANIEENNSLNAYSDVGKEVVTNFDELLSQEEDAREVDYWYTLEDGDSSSVFLLKNEFISENAYFYISKMEVILSDESKSLFIMENEIREIQNLAIANLSEKDLMDVMNYSVVANSMLEYFDSSESARFGWKKFTKICKIVGSAAASAVAGGAVGFFAGGPAVATAAAIGSAVSGAYAAYKSDKVEVRGSANY
ncbi:MAG: hypothetical protein IKO57_09285 [Treponema sp.]|nr:hypothetical protein [Treponema sp.]